MNELPLHIRKDILRYKSVTVDDFTFHPILVDEYSEFTYAKPAINCVQRSFPVAYISMPLLSAFYKMDYENLQNGTEAVGLFGKAVMFLLLSLRLGEGEELEERLKRVRLIADNNEPTKLKALCFLFEDGSTKEMTPVQFQRYRPILAAQNGIKLVGDDENPDLIEAENEIASQNAPTLDYTVEALVTAVAAISGVEEADIYSWPILKLQSRSDAYKRFMDYMICGIGESQGTKWNRGNPCPHPFYERIRTDSNALISMNSFAGGAGLKAMQQQGY